MDLILSALGGVSGLAGVLGGIGGALVRFAAQWQARVARKDEMKHELDLLDRQATLEAQRAERSKQAAKELNEQQLAVIAAQASSELQQTDALNWQQALTDQLRPTGIQFIDSLTMSVRPVLTYWWCVVIYTAAKIALLVALFSGGASPDAAKVAAVLMTEFDKAVIASLIGFWFVDRALRRAT